MDHIVRIFTKYYVIIVLPMHSFQLVFSGKVYAKQEQPGYKKGATPIRSYNGYKRPKTLRPRS